ncbi:MAG: T9SS type A sorting domain-containing protein [Ignavibacteria bacterium]|nr:T9SS type A sorting domain-containing protein [Ignavibacteria bacterium]
MTRWAGMTRWGENDNVVPKVFDLLGREVAELVNGNLQPGTYEVTSYASGLSSGIYFYKFTAGDFSDVKKMLYVK